MSRKPFEGFDVAQVCPNGHVANSSTRNMPEYNKEFCETCGEKTITACPACVGPIRGPFWGGGYFDKYGPPAYCDSCGKAFPWTEIAATAAIELLRDELRFTDEEAKELEQNVRDVVRNSPRTHVAASRLKRVLAKASVGVGRAFRDVLVNIVSEQAKQVLWPSS